MGRAPLLPVDQRSISMRLPKLVLSLSLFAFASCSLPQLDVAPRYAQLSLEGDFGISSGGATANGDLETMGLDDSEGAPGVRADFAWSGAHVIVSSTAVEFSGSGVADTTFTSGGVTIPSGATVDSDLDLGLHSAIVLWDIFPGDMIEISAGLGVTLIDFEMNIVDTGSSMSVNADETLPVPLLAANAGVMLGDLEANLLVSGFSISADGNSGSYIDLDASLRYKLFGGQNHVRTSIIAGWRQIDIELDYTDSGDNIDGDIRVSGPYLAFEVTL